MKKLTALLLTLILSLQMTAVFAAGTPNVAVGTVTGETGKTVDVTVSLSNCAEWTNIGLYVEYDASVLSLLSATNNAAGKILTTSNELTVNPYYIGWAGTENSDYNGTMATLSFQILESAAEGTYPITLSFYTGRNGTYTDGKQVNYVTDWATMKKTALGLTYTAGSVTVKKAEPTLAATSADGKTVSITTTGKTDGKIIAALYDGNMMSDIVIEDVQADFDVSFKEGKTGNQIKVMWWDGIDTLNSIAGPVIIPVANN